MKAEINPNARITWNVVGDLRSPVLIVDDFLKNPDEVRSFALTLRFSAPVPGDYYPGVKASATLDGAHEILEWITREMLQRMVLKTDHATVDHSSSCTFSVLACDTTKIPEGFYDQHVDTKGWLATVLHLSLSNTRRATAFWQHRPTGLECWPLPDILHVRGIEQTFGIDLTSQLDRAVQRLPLFSAHALHRSVFKFNRQRRPFATDEDEQWKVIGLVPGEYNRLVVYPTWQIHSVIDMSEVNGLDERSMRLTMNQLIDYPFPFSPKRSEYPTSFYRKVVGLRC